MHQNGVARFQIDLRTYDMSIAMQNELRIERIQNVLHRHRKHVLLILNIEQMIKYIVLK